MINVENVEFWAVFSTRDGRTYYIPDHAPSEELAGTSYVLAKRCKPGNARNPRGKWVRFQWGTQVNLTLPK